MRKTIPDNWNHKNGLQAPSSLESLKEGLYRRFSKSGLWYQRFRRFMHGLTWILVVQLLLGAKRVLDILVALTLMIFLFPIFAGIFLILGPKGPLLQHTPKVGRWCEVFYEYSFTVPEGYFGRLLVIFGIHRLPVLWNILCGDMSFVGPRPVLPGDLSPRERAARRRYDVRPGLICLWWIRQRTNIAYGSEVEADCEYVEKRSVWGDLGIALRAIPAILYGEGVTRTSDLVTILGIPINNMTMSEVVETVAAWLREPTPDITKSNKPRQICFVNAYCANLAYHDEEYLQVLQNADLTLADGIGMKLAGKLLARDIRQNVNGTDLFPRLCETLSSPEEGLFLLGGRPGVAEGVCHWLAKHHPNVIVKGYHHGYFSSEEEEQIIRQITDSRAKLLLIAFGAPHQDKWTRRNLRKTGVKVAMGVGGLFDFYSGRIPRAPLWVREMGMEWLYRFYQEPRRMWKRYFLGNAIFLFRVIKERMKK
jgi:N-acetylglucosaminyldiphosphoundecaprenol N-acetyl-beta-D-mannosaminyltransferase